MNRTPFIGKTFTNEGGFLYVYLKKNFRIVVIFHHFILYDNNNLQKI
jgi:hypothetical protein